LQLASLGGRASVDTPNFDENYITSEYANLTQEFTEASFDSNVMPNSSKTRKTSKKSGKWIFWLLLLVLTLALIGTSYKVNKVVTDSNLCVDCHEMRPEYYTWANSSHKEIKCTDCHLPLNNSQRIFRNVLGFKQLTRHLSGLETEDITVWQKVTNENCLKCHSKNRVYTPSGDLIIPHYLHDENNVECVSCHGGVVHGRIVERGKIKQLPRASWTNYNGHLESEFANTRPQMIQCLQCHRARNASNKCENCHKLIPTPPSHQPETWEQGHGKEAWQDVNRCSKCHIEQGLEDTFDKKAVVQYIRSNQFCSNCHNSLKPSNHFYGWAHEHANLVTRDEVPYCMVCHDANKDGNKGIFKGTKIYCNKCHGIYYVGERLTQPIDWIK
jgi:nitrate/TMAO reductase-like tetraheme cytochrome c subunit